ncbi:MAG TPA: tetratricopeptide repeat protein [Microvirga sp.]|jgi:adenylate cyclase|nr:tetratricopeptide repeat protein [Microvirga sp.]
MQTVAVSTGKVLRLRRPTPGRFLAPARAKAGAAPVPGEAAQPASDERKRIAARIRDHIARERLSREQFAFKTKLGKSTIDKLLIGLFSDKTLSIVESHTGLVLRAPADGAPEPSGAAGACAVVAPLPFAARPSIAVLPFTNMSPDREQEYFADGVVEDIITALSRIRQLFVIARSSTFTYKGRAVDVRQVGRELGVRYVLEGSVRRAGRRLRITGQLVEAETGRHIWADRFDGDWEDVFELQDRITEGVVGAIEPNVRYAEIERARRKPTANLDAYDLYLRALPSFYKMTAEGLADAIAIFDRVSALDPDFTLGKAQASYARAVRLSCGKGEPDDRAIAIRLAREIAASGTEDPEALRRVAHVLGYNAKAYEEALGAITRSLELNANSATAYNSSGWIRLYLDQPGTAQDHFQRAIRLSPLDPERGMATTGLAVSCLMQGRPADGLAHARQALREMPQYPTAHKVLIQAFVLTGREEEARAAASRFLEMSPGYTLGYQQKITPYSNQAYCRQVIDALRRAGLPE